MNKMRQKRNRAASALFVAGIVILSLILLGEVYYIYSELTEEHTRYPMEERDYVNLVNYEEYFRIYSEVADDSATTRKLTTTENEIRALGYYYEAAALYKAYLAVEDEDSAAKQMARMERYRAQAGSYAGETEKIDERLKIG